MLYSEYHLCFHHIPKRMNETLLLARTIDFGVSTAVDQIHRRNGEGAGFVHVDHRHHLLGGRLTAGHGPLGMGAKMLKNMES